MRGSARRPALRVKVGIQTASGDVEFPDDPVNPGTGTGVGYVTSEVRTFVDFDPTVAGNGNIGTKSHYRLGLFYSSTDATVSRGEVLVELYADA